MSSMQQVLAAAPPVSVKGPRRPPGHRHLRGSDFRWAIAFVLPYASVFLVFVVYPFGYALWMARKPSLYADLIFDPLYPRAIVNTLLFVGLGVNVKMFLALLLSGFFLRPRWWIKAPLEQPDRRKLSPRGPQGLFDELSLDRACRGSSCSAAAAPSTP